MNVLCAFGEVRRRLIAAPIRVQIVVEPKAKREEIIIKAITSPNKCSPGREYAAVVLIVTAIALGFIH